MKPRNNCGFEIAKIGRFEPKFSEIAFLKTVKISWFHLVKKRLIETEQACPE
jgi:hypothetical protein